VAALRPHSRSLAGLRRGRSPRPTTAARTRPDDDNDGNALNLQRLDSGQHPHSRKLTQLAHESVGFEEGMDDLTVMDEVIGVLNFMNVRRLRHESPLESHRKP